MRPRLATLAVAALLVLAGCNFGPGGNGAPGATDTLSADETPPGVTDGRLANATALLSNHTRLLNESGFETDLHTNATLRQAGQLRRVERRQQTLVEPGAAPYRYTVTNPGAVIDVWSNGTAVAQRVETGNRTTFRSGTQPAPARVLTGEGLLGRYLRNGEYSVVNVTRRNGTTYTTLRSTSPPEGVRVFPRNATDTRNFTAAVVVDGQGRIHSFAARGDYTIEGRDASYSLEYELVQTDRPTVERPDWVSRALS